MEPQSVDLFQPLIASRKGPAPLVLRVGVRPTDVYTEGGAVSAPVKAEAYVLLSALPAELRRQVETAVQALISGM